MRLSYNQLLEGDRDNNQDEEEGGKIIITSNYFIKDYMFYGKHKKNRK